MNICTKHIKLNLKESILWEKKMHVFCYLNNSDEIILKWKRIINNILYIVVKYNTCTCMFSEQSNERCNWHAKRVVNVSYLSLFWVNCIE